jgi:hypothetical protein
MFNVKALIGFQLDAYPTESEAVDEKPRKINKKWAIPFVHDIRWLHLFSA